MHARTPVTAAHVGAEAELLRWSSSRRPASHCPLLFFLTFLVRLMLPLLASPGLSVAPDSSSCRDEQRTVSQNWPRQCSMQRRMRKLLENEQSPPNPY